MADQPPRETMNGKPVLYRENARTVLTFKSTEFREKLLCDGITLNLGDACAYSCEFCYVEASMMKIDKPVLNAHNAGHDGKAAPIGFQDVVIRRRNTINLLREQLLTKGNATKFTDPADRRVVYSSTLVDVAANLELLRETAKACNLIFENSPWQIRLLSKSSLLHKLIADRLIPEKYHDRLILGFSTGTLDDKLAKAFETGTALVSKRIQSLHWLQDRGIRTFGMICPSLPQEDYGAFSREICAAIRIDRCEHVWAEVINLRGKSLTRTLSALRRAKLNEEADRLEAVSGGGNSEHWEQYARNTFLAHTHNVPPGKLRFLQYVDAESADWWSKNRERGALLLGGHAKESHLTALDVKIGQIVPFSALPMTNEDAAYRQSRESLVTDAVKRSIEAAQALYEIYTYKGGLLWHSEFPRFEAYCQDRWGYAKSHAYRLKDSGEFIADLRKSEIHSPIGEWLPKNESQIRPVLSLEKEDRVECWRNIVENQDSAIVTGRDVSRHVREGVKSQQYREKKSPPSKPHKKEDPRKRALKALVALEAAMADLKLRRQASSELEGLRKMIEMQ